MAGLARGAKRALYSASQLARVAWYTTHYLAGRRRMGPLTRPGEAPYAEEFAPLDRARLKESFRALFRDEFEYRGPIHQMYRNIWDIKILRNRFPLMVKTIRDGEKVLDMGASNRNLQDRLRRSFPKLIYKTMDIDREQFHDFYSLEEIQEFFDVVFLFEVIEHLDIEEGVQLLKKIHNLLNGVGRLILTTPNVFNPGRFWRDATHKVAYCYVELGGLLLSQGFQIKMMYRIYSDAFHRYLFRLYVMAPLHRYLGIDFAKSILVVAEKKT